MSCNCCICKVSKLVLKISVLSLPVVNLVPKDETIVPSGKGGETVLPILKPPLFCVTIFVKIEDKESLTISFSNPS